MKKKIGITIGALALIVVLYFVLRNRIGENSQDYKS
jgi:hypothetical protein